MVKRWRKWLHRLTGREAHDALARQVGALEKRLVRVERVLASDTSPANMIGSLTKRLDKLEFRAGQTDHRLMLIGKPQDGDFKIIENNWLALGRRVSALEARESHWGMMVAGKPVPVTFGDNSLYATVDERQRD